MLVGNRKTQDGAARDQEQTKADTHRIHLRKRRLCDIRITCCTQVCVPEIRVCAWSNGPHPWRAWLIQTYSWPARISASGGREVACPLHSATTRRRMISHNRRQRMQQQTLGQ